MNHSSADNIKSRCASISKKVPILQKVICRRITLQQCYQFVTQNISHYPNLTLPKAKNLPVISCTKSRICSGQTTDPRLQLCCMSYKVTRGLRPEIGSSITTPWRQVEITGVTRNHKTEVAKEIQFCQTVTCSLVALCHSATKFIARN